MNGKPQGKYIERLSTMLVVLAFVGTIIVLIDPVITFETAGGTVLRFGGTGFSDQLKGAVVSLILVSGFAGVIGYWLGASNTGDKAQESVSNIATAAGTGSGGAAAIAAAAGAAPAPGSKPPGGPMQTGDVTINTPSATVNEIDTKDK